MLFEPMQRGAAIIAWFFWFVIGAGLGAFLGACTLACRLPRFIRRLFGDDRYRLPMFWMKADYIPLFLVGAALLCAAYTSYLGDRLWHGRSYYDLAPSDEVPWEKGLIISQLIGVLGLLLMLAAVLGHFGAF